MTYIQQQLPCLMYLVFLPRSNIISASPGFDGQFHNFLYCSLVFGFGHAYQGVRGMFTTAIVGAFFSAVYLLTGSLYAGMLMHALMDAHSGHLMWAAYDRAPAPPPEPEETAA